MIARHLINNKNNYYYDITKPHTWQFVSQSIMGEAFAKRYEFEKIKEEKVQLEQSLENNTHPTKKLKV